MLKFSISRTSFKLYMVKLLIYCLKSCSRKVFLLFRMLTERAHGVKRKHSEVDSNSHELHGRCIQRQTVFNISLCKLQKSFSRPEPVLCRTVLISNTLRLIEQDIREERRTLEMTVVTDLSDDKTFERGIDNISEQVTFSAHSIGTRSCEGFSLAKSSLTFEQELNILGDKMVKELEFEIDKPSNTAEMSAKLELTGQNTSRAADLNNNTSMAENSEKLLNFNTEEMIKEVTCGSLLGLELTEELEFKDVDVSLYDFDVPNSAFPIDFDEFCSAWNLGTTSIAAKSLPARCSDSLKLERVNEFAIDELEQVMQILVGS